jgi:hypothetical protein
MAAAGFLPAAASSLGQVVAPPPPLVSEALGLGRREAVGSAFWIVTSQLIGSDVYARAGYPQLERWLEQTFALNPYLRDGYILGTVTLLVDKDRAESMRRLLAQGEQRFPDDFQFPMLQGIAAYFGQLDAQGAATDFERAATRRNAPPFLSAFGRRLREQSATCGTLLLNLRSLSREDRLGDLMKSAFDVYATCVKRELEQAAAAFKLREGRVPDGLGELLRAGLVQRAPEAPPGMCWSVINVNAYVHPCQEAP